MKIDSAELIEALYELRKDKKLMKSCPLSKFTFNEVMFITELILFRPKDIVYFYIATNIIERSEIGGGLFDCKNYRRYLFILNYFKCKGNCTQAAILSGYAPRSAKQQGHRILKEIQGYFRSQRK